LREARNWDEHHHVTSKKSQAFVDDSDKLGDDDLSPGGGYFLQAHPELFFETDTGFVAPATTIDRSATGDFNALSIRMFPLLILLFYKQFY
jgi:hypothetical protein